MLMMRPCVERHCIHKLDVRCLRVGFLTHGHTVELFCDENRHTTKLLCGNCEKSFVSVAQSINTSHSTPLQGTPDDPGIVQRAIRDVFKSIQQTPERDFLLRFSMMEIYNEVCHIFKTFLAQSV